MKKTAIFILLFVILIVVFGCEKKEQKIVETRENQESVQEIPKQPLKQIPEEIKSTQDLDNAINELNLVD